MKKQTILINNNGEQDATVFIIQNLAELGFSIICDMNEDSSKIKAEREFQEDAPDETIH